MSRAGVHVTSLAHRSRRTDLYNHTERAMRSQHPAVNVERSTVKCAFCAGGSALTLVEVIDHGVWERNK